MAHTSGIETVDGTAAPPPAHKRASTYVDSHVGMMVKMRRTERGLSQDKLAAAIGITAQQLQKYERGTNRIGASRLHQIAEVLEAPIQYFFRGLDLPAVRNEGNGLGQEMSQLTTALCDAATFRLLCMFSEVRDPQLKSRVLNLVEAVIDRG